MVILTVTWNVHNVIFTGRGTLGTDKMKEGWFLEDSTSHLWSSCSFLVWKET